MPLGAVAHVAISDAFIVVIIVNPRPPHPSAAHVCVPSQQLSASTNRNWFLLQVRASLSCRPQNVHSFQQIHPTPPPLSSLSLLQVPQIRRSSSANLTPSKSTCDPSAGLLMRNFHDKVDVGHKMESAMQMQPFRHCCQGPRWSQFTCCTSISFRSAGQADQKATVSFYPKQSNQLENDNKNCWEKSWFFPEIFPQRSWH